MDAWMDSLPSQADEFFLSTIFMGFGASSFLSLFPFFFAFLFLYRSCSPTCYSVRLIYIYMYSGVRDKRPNSSGHKRAKVFWPAVAHANETIAKKNFYPQSGRVLRAPISI